MCICFFARYCCACTTTPKDVLLSVLVCPVFCAPKFLCELRFRETVFIQTVFDILYASGESEKNWKECELVIQVGSDVQVDKKYMFEQHEKADRKKDDGDTTEHLSEGGFSLNRKEWSVLWSEYGGAGTQDESDQQHPESQVERLHAVYHQRSTAGRPVYHGVRPWPVHSQRWVCFLLLAGSKCRAWSV